MLYQQGLEEAELLNHRKILGLYSTASKQRMMPLDECFFFFFFFFCLFAISWATPAAYGGSQARGLIGAVAVSLHRSHSNVGSEPCL